MLFVLHSCLTLVDMSDFHRNTYISNLTQFEQVVLNSLDCGHYRCAILPKVLHGTKTKYCNYCSTNVRASNWAKHQRSNKHITNEAKVESRSDDSEAEFELAAPTVVAGPSTRDSQESREVFIAF